MYITPKGLKSLGSTKGKVFADADNVFKKIFRASGAMIAKNPI